jgi:hypothetical protein
MTAVLALGLTFGAGIGTESPLDHAAAPHNYLPQGSGRSIATYRYI